MAEKSLCFGDNVFEYSIGEHVHEYTEQNVGARILLKEVGDPERSASRPWTRR
jgi:dTDP-glucose pyrophosphorylase